MDISRGGRSCQVIMMGLAIALGSVGCGTVDVPLGGQIDTSTGNASSATVAPVTDGESSAVMTGGSDDGEAPTGSDSAASDEGLDDSNDSGCSFYAGCSPDGGDEYECNIYLQDCPSGEKCMPWANDGGGAWNATRCSPVASDPGEPGDPCTVEGNGVSGIDDCDVGVMCFDVDSKTNEGVCHGMCSGSEAMPVCEDPETACVTSNEGVLALCLTTCDPVLQDCAEGEGCYAVPDDDAFLCAPVARPGQPGEECEFINVCDSGLACIEGELLGCMSLGCCTSFCDLGDPMADAGCDAVVPGHACVPWHEEGTAPAGEEHIGLCRLPE